MEKITNELQKIRVRKLLLLPPLSLIVLCAINILMNYYIGIPIFFSIFVFLFSTIYFILSVMLVLYSDFKTNIKN